MKRLVLILLFLYSAMAYANIFIERVVEDDFANIKEDITLAITGQGLVIAHHSDVSTMLNRTAMDLASQAFNTITNIIPSPFSNNRARIKTTYNHGLVIEFCSASLSAQTTKADPNNILLCPFSIAIFQLRNEPNQVHVSYLRLSKFADENNLASVKALQAVENMLASIVSEALD